MTPAIKFVTPRTKPLSQVTANDIPPGLDAYDVMTYDDTTLAFIDKERSLDQKVLTMLKDAKIPFALRPSKEDHPIISYASKEYSALEDIESFIKEYTMTDPKGDN